MILNGEIVVRRYRKPTTGGIAAPSESDAPPVVEANSS